MRSDSVFISSPVSSAHTPPNTTVATESVSQSIAMPPPKNEARSTRSAPEKKAHTARTARIA